jgi:hypothetical protein
VKKTVHELDGDCTCFYRINRAITLVCEPKVWEGQMRMSPLVWKEPVIDDDPKTIHRTKLVKHTGVVSAMPTQRTFTPAQLQNGYANARYVKRRSLGSGSE